MLILFDSSLFLIYLCYPNINIHIIHTNTIGCGAFSSVYRARIKSKENAYVAIKIMDLEHISSSFEDILQEVQTMKMCDDPNILRCYCSFVNADQLWLVTEMMDKGSCLRVMTVARQLGMGEGMSEEWLAYILREALQGLHYLHNNGQSVSFIYLLFCCSQIVMMDNLL